MSDDNSQGTFNSRTRTIQEFLTSKTYPKHYNRTQRSGVYQEAKKYCLVDGILYRRTESPTGNKRLRVIHGDEIELKAEILMAAHTGNKVQHHGVNQMMTRIKENYYWHGYTNDVRSFIRECEVCQDKQILSLDEVLHPVRKQKTLEYKERQRQGLKDRRRIEAELKMLTDYPCENYIVVNTAKRDATEENDVVFDMKKNHYVVKGSDGEPLPTESESGITTVINVADIIQSVDGQRTVQTEELLKTGKFPPEFSPNQRLYLRQSASMYTLIDNKLYKKPKLKRLEDYKKVIHDKFPEKKLKIIIKSHIDESGKHLGLNKTTKKMTEKYYWRGLTDDLHRFARACQTCSKNQQRTFDELKLMEKKKPQRKLEAEKQKLASAKVRDNAVKTLGTDSVASSPSNDQAITDAQVLNDIDDVYGINVFNNVEIDINHKTSANKSHALTPANYLPLTTAKAKAVSSIESATICPSTSIQSPFVDSVAMDEVSKHLYRSHSVLPARLCPVGFMADSSPADKCTTAAIPEIENISKNLDSRHVHSDITSRSNSYDVTNSCVDNEAIVVDSNNTCSGIVESEGHNSPDMNISYNLDHTVRNCLNTTVEIQRNNHTVTSNSGTLMSAYMYRDSDGRICANNVGDFQTNSSLLSKKQIDTHIAHTVPSKVKNESSTSTKNAESSASKMSQYSSNSAIHTQHAKCPGSLYSLLSKKIVKCTPTDTFDVSENNLKTETSKKSTSVEVSKIYESSSDMQPTDKSMYSLLSKKFLNVALDEVSENEIKSSTARSKDTDCIEANYSITEGCNKSKNNKRSTGGLYSLISKTIVEVTPTVTSDNKTEMNLSAEKSENANNAKSSVAKMSETFLNSEKQRNATGKQYSLLSKRLVDVPVPHELNENGTNKQTSFSACSEKTIGEDIVFRISEEDSVSKSLQASNDDKSQIKKVCNLYSLLSKSSVDAMPAIPCGVPHNTVLELSENANGAEDRVSKDTGTSTKTIVATSDCIAISAGIEFVHQNVKTNSEANKEDDPKTAATSNTNTYENSHNIGDSCVVRDGKLHTQSTMYSLVSRKPVDVTYSFSYKVCENRTATADTKGSITEMSVDGNRTTAIDEEPTCINGKVRSREIEQYLKDGTYDPNYTYNQKESLAKVALRYMYSEAAGVLYRRPDWNKRKTVLGLVPVVHDDCIARQLDIINNMHVPIRATGKDNKHLPATETIELIQQNFYWVGMNKMVMMHISKCKCRIKISPLVLGKLRKRRDYKRRAVMSEMADASSRGTYNRTRIIQEFLTSKTYPKHFNRNQKSGLYQTSKKFVMKDGILYRRPQSQTCRNKKSGLYQTAKQFVMKDGILYRSRQQLQTCKDPLRVIHEDEIEWKTEILMEAHMRDDGGHSGFNRMLKRIMEKYYWLGRTCDIQLYLGECDVCQARQHAKTTSSTSDEPTAKRRKTSSTIGGLACITEKPIASMEDLSEVVGVSEDGSDQDTCASVKEDCLSTNMMNVKHEQEAVKPLATNNGSEVADPAQGPEENNTEDTKPPRTSAMLLTQSTVNHAPKKMLKFADTFEHFVGTKVKQSLMTTISKSQCTMIAPSNEPNKKNVHCFRQTLSTKRIPEFKTDSPKPSNTFQSNTIEKDQSETPNTRSTKRLGSKVVSSMKDKVPPAAEPQKSGSRSSTTTDVSLNQDIVSDIPRKAQRVRRQRLMHSPEPEAKISKLSFKYMDQILKQSSKLDPCHRLQYATSEQQAKANPSTHVDLEQDADEDYRPRKDNSKSRNVRKLKQCEVCEKLKADERLLEVHSRSHRNKTEACSKCSEKFFTSIHLVLHYESEHGDPPIYKCDICRAKFASKKYLKSEIHLDGNLLFYSCVMCRPKFNSSSGV